MLSPTSTKAISLLGPTHDDDDDGTVCFNSTRTLADSVVVFPSRSFFVRMYVCTLRTRAFNGWHDSLARHTCLSPAIIHTVCTTFTPLPNFVFSMCRRLFDAHTRTVFSGIGVFLLHGNDNHHHTHSHTIPPAALSPNGAPIFSLFRCACTVM